MPYLKVKINIVLYKSYLGYFISRFNTDLILKNGKYSQSVQKKLKCLTSFKNLGGGISQPKSNTFFLYV